MTMSMTYKVDPYKKGFGPFLSNIQRLEFPEHSIDLSDLEFDPQKIACMVIEPVAGEGGFIPVSKESSRSIFSPMAGNYSKAIDLYQIAVKDLRRLEALMAIGDKDNSYIISGTGDVLEPEGDVIGIGSGGNYALASAKVLMDTDLSAEEVAKKAIKVASEICVFTNDNCNIEKI